MTRTLLVLALALTASLTAAASVAPGPGIAPGQNPQDRFGQSDSNHDGRLSLAEWQHMREERMAEQFRRIDVDHDGGLSAQEIRQAHRQGQLQRASRRHQRMAMHEKLRALDVDGDQALSRAEIGESMPRLAQNFDRIDLNHDGKLTRDELRAARAALRTLPR